MASYKPATSLEWFSSALDSSGYKATDVAKHIGATPALVSLWRRKLQEIPMGRLISLARFFGADPLYVRNLKMNDLGWDTWETDERIRNLVTITASELEFIEILRNAKKANPKMDEAQKAEFRAFVEKLSGEL